MTARPTHRRKPLRRDAGRPRGPPVARAVLTRTLEELARSGLEGLSVERIARRAEVNKTSIYRRWPTRGALVAAALEGLLEGLAARVPDTGSLGGDLEGLLGQVARLLAQPVGRAVARAAMSEASRFEVARLASRRLAAPPSGPVRGLVERAVARGEWRAGVRAPVALSALVGAALHRALLEQAPLDARWRREVVALVVDGVRPRPLGPASPR